MNDYIDDEKLSCGCWMVWSVSSGEWKHGLLCQKHIKLHVDVLERNER